MTPPDGASRSRQQRRKQRTRAALVRVAQALLAAGRTDVPIAEITEAADVGVLLHNALALALSDKGLALRARRDLEAAATTGRFAVRDPELAMTVVAGATLCLGQLLHEQPDRDDARATDLVTEDLLRMLGVSADEARRICRRPLPDLDDPDHKVEFDQS